jgi:adenylosuccinate synthase
VIHAVIGAHYGDEGKGLVTDVLCDQPHTLVIRHNGGAQAGHTVVTPENNRHVFHHIGAGALRGVDTLLARHFLVNPILFNDEHNRLLRIVRPPSRVFVDANALVTTPFDMLLNQAVERQRGDARHGSCGLGINETVTRSQHPEFTLRVSDLESRELLCNKLFDIATFWMPMRSALLGIAPPPFNTTQYISQFATDVALFLEHVTLVHDASLVQDYQHLVFEGAQGLLLDEVNGMFPHVTRSRTGLTNVVDLLERADWQEPIVATYVTRTYVTRHGCGPMLNEWTTCPFVWGGDTTNVTNEWQGHLRFGPLDVRSMVGAILIDVNSAQWSVVPELFVTCVDQYPTPLAEILRCRIPVIGTSHGPTRDTVRFKTLTTLRF